MQRKTTRRKQLYIVLGLSLLVFACLLIEVQKRGILLEPQTLLDNALPDGNAETAQNEQKNITEASNVRVLITNTNFESLFHKKIKITSSKPFCLSIDGKKKNYAAGEVVTYSSKSKTLKGKKIIFEPSENARLKILSIKRQNINPSYRGTMQVTWKKSGLLLTNELSLEQYLYAVVPSELSTGHKMEALKAQAVCARSYAYNQIKSQRYKKYNADLEDSVACQVYNNIPEDKRSRKAVNATKGLVLTNKKKVLQAYYYSTSWGYSASGQDVWNTKSEISYLPEKLQCVETSVNLQNLDLSNEGQFQKFINEKMCETYDSSADWYRWSVTISQDSLSNRVDKALAACYQSNPSLVLTQQKDGTYKKEALRPLGKIKKIRIAKREKSGLVTQLEIVGSKNVVKVCTQYNIRKVLTPTCERISYKSGQSSTTMSLLPSAAFYVKTISNKADISFCFVGGGFGHGTGMSQCGAAEMAKRGKTFKEILTHYYSGAVIKKMSAIG